MKKQIITITILGVFILGGIGIFLLTVKQKTQPTSATNNPIHHNASSLASPTPLQGITSPSVTQQPLVTVTTNDHTHDLEIQHQQKTEPDLFLSNNLPYQTHDFDASAAFTSSPTDHFYFTVVTKNGNPDGAKQKFLTWVQSLGLTQEQINKLDIRYE